jgi:hypothetical protein
MRGRAIAWTVLLIALSAFIVSCGGGGGGGLPNLTAGLFLIDVEPYSSSVGVGSTKQFTATGWYKDGSTKDLTGLAGWKSSNTSYATVNNKGLATGVATGTCQITASYGGISSYSYLYVTPPVVTLVSIAVTPASAEIQETATKQFAATGTYSDASTQDLTSSATWTSSNQAVAFVSNTYGTKGLATGMAAGGPITLSATYGGITGNASVTVIPRRSDLSVRITGVVSSGTNTVTVSYTAENNGLADASAFYVDVWPNEATPPSLGTTSSTRNSHAGLVVGGRISGTVTLSSPLTSGTAYAIVDTEDSVTESDETNNVSAGYPWPFAGYACANVANTLGGFCADTPNGFELTAPVGGSLTFGGYGFASYPTTTGIRNTCSLALYGDNGVVTLEPSTSSSQENYGPYETHWAGSSYSCASNYGSALISAGSTIDWSSYQSGDYSCGDGGTDAGLTTLTCVYPFVPTTPPLATYDFNDQQVPGDFTLTGNANWTPYATDSSLQSGAIGNSQTSCFAVTRASASGVRFDLRVDSESGYDKLRFYVDGSPIDSWSGAVAWTTGVYYSQTLGTHEYKWCYEKDYIALSGQDAAWVDNISIY